MQSSDEYTVPAGIGDRLVPLLLIVGLFFFNIFARSVLSPLLLPMEEEFSISHAASSRFFLYISAGYALTIILSGFVSHALMHRRTIFLSSFLASFGLLVIGFAPGLPMVHLGLVIIGCGAGLFPPSSISMITEMIKRGDWQKALAVNELGPHLAMLAVPLYAAALLPYGDWRVIIVSAGVLMMVLTLLSMRLIRVGNNRGEPPKITHIAALIHLPAFWIMILLFGLGLSSIQGVYLLIPSYLVTEGGFTLSQANTIFGISRVVPIAALMSAGLVIDSIGIRRGIGITIFLAGASIVLVGLLEGIPLIIMIFLQPAAGALFFPAGIAAVSLIGPSRTRNVAFSMLLPLASFLGTGAIPAFIGYMGEHASFRIGFIAAGAVTCLSSFLAVFLKIEEKPGKTE